MTKERLMHVEIVPDWDKKSAKRSGDVRFKKGASKRVREKDFFPEGTVRVHMAVTVLRSGRIGNRSYLAEMQGAERLGYGSGKSPKAAIVDMVSVTKEVYETVSTHDDFLMDVEAAKTVYKLKIKESPQAEK